MRFNLAASAIKNLFSALLSLAILSCANAQESQISVSVWPEFGLGGPDRLTHVAGRVQGVDFSDKAIYLFAEADRLYKQPLAETRNIPIAKSGYWQSPTHLGRRYHVILAAKYYNPPGILMNIPRRKVRSTLSPPSKPQQS